MSFMLDGRPTNHDMSILDAHNNDYDQHLRYFLSQDTSYKSWQSILGAIRLLFSLVVPSP